MKRPKRYKQIHDLDFREPAMSVIRNYRMADGSTRVEVDPDYEQRYRQHLMETSPYPHPSADPTYNLRRKHEKTRT